MIKIIKFTDLMAWQESHAVVLEIYSILRKFPKQEMFGLTIQMKRAAISVTSNIAEGFGRRTYKDKCHFFYQSRGSLIELRNQLIIARDIKYISLDEYIAIDQKIDNAHRLLQGLITKTTSLISNL